MYTCAQLGTVSPWVHVYNITTLLIDTLVNLSYTADWKCKRLECEKSRWVIMDPIYLSNDQEALIYEYCSVQDKAVWGKPAKVTVGGGEGGAGGHHPFEQ